MYRCLKGFSIKVLLIGLSMPNLSLSLVYPIGSSYLSLTRSRSLTLGYPFFPFSNCSYKIKRLLGFVPMFFFFSGVTINARSIGTYQ